MFCLTSICFICLQDMLTLLWPNFYLFLCSAFLFWSFHDWVYSLCPLFQFLWWNLLLLCPPLIHLLWTFSRKKSWKNPVKFTFLFKLFHVLPVLMLLISLFKRLFFSFWSAVLKISMYYWTQSRCLCYISSLNLISKI